MPNQKRVRQKAARARRLEEQRRLAHRSQFVKRVIIVVVVAAVVIGTAAALLANGSTTTTTTSSIAAAQAAANEVARASGCPASTSTRVNTLTFKSRPKMTIMTDINYYATVKTTAGSFVIELEPKLAPVSVNSFIYLAGQAFYTCTIFQRVIPGFMMQGGDPTGTGAGVLGYTLPDEYPKGSGDQYPNYTVALANAGPNTSSDQFFIVDGSEGADLAPTYNIIGKVITGQNVIDTIVGYGNASQSSNGTPPLVTERLLSIGVSVTPP